MQTHAQTPPNAIKPKPTGVHSKVVSALFSAVSLCVLKRSWLFVANALAKDRRGALVLAAFSTAFASSGTVTVLSVASTLAVRPTRRANILDS